METPFYFWNLHVIHPFPFEEARAYTICYFWNLSWIMFSICIFAHTFGTFEIWTGSRFSLWRSLGYTYITIYIYISISISLSLYIGVHGPGRGCKLFCVLNFYRRLGSILYMNIFFSQHTSYTSYTCICIAFSREDTLRALFFKGSTIKDNKDCHFFALVWHTSAIAFSFCFIYDIWMT